MPRAAVFAVGLHVRQGLARAPKASGLAEASPHYLGHRERLRARFREAGADAVTDYELLELVLFRDHSRGATSSRSPRS